MAALRDKYVRGRDDMVEQWAVNQANSDPPMPEIIDRPTIEEEYSRPISEKIGQGQMIRLKQM